MMPREAQKGLDTKNPYHLDRDLKLFTQFSYYSFGSSF